MPESQPSQPRDVRSRRSLVAGPVATPRSSDRAERHEEENIARNGDHCDVADSRRREQDPAEHETVTTGAVHEVMSNEQKPETYERQRERDPRHPQRKG